MKVFYHNDLDGHCAAYIVALHDKVSELNQATEDSFIEINYGIPFPFDEINPSEVVYIVDYSIEPEEMEKLLKITKNVHWIDHHISTIQKYDGFKHDVLGVRKDGVAGCVLTYQYLFGKKCPVPSAILYVGDRDVWTFIFGDDTRNFCSGAELYDTHPFNGAWNILLEHPETVIEAGKTINSYRKSFYKKYVDAFSYRTEFEGHQAIVVNAGMVGSDIFDDISYLPALQIMYIDEGERIRVSLRSTTIDVAEIASKYGGGGHKGAAGFECNQIPWAVKRFNKQQVKDRVVKRAHETEIAYACPSPSEIVDMVFKEMEK